MMQPRVLLVEADSARATLLRRRFLAAGYTLECVDNYTEAAEFMTYDSADLAVLSSIDGDMLPAELCAQVRQKHNDRVLLTVLGPADNNLRVLSYRAGADDYICQTAEPDTIALRLATLLKNSALRRDILGLGKAIGANYLLVGKLTQEGVLGALQVGFLLSDIFRVMIDSDFQEQGNIWVQDHIIVGATYGIFSAEAALTQLCNLHQGCFRIVEERCIDISMQQPLPLPVTTTKLDAVA